MKPKHIYLALCVAGTVIPYYEFWPWLMAHGLDLRLMQQELFANRVSSFFALDLLLSAAVLIRFALIERRRGSVRLWWLPIVATLAVGVSLGLPLLLYLRELEIEKAQASAVGA